MDIGVVTDCKRVRAGHEPYFVHHDDVETLSDEALHTRLLVVYAFTDEDTTAVVQDTVTELRDDYVFADGAIFPKSFRDTIDELDWEVLWAAIWTLTVKDSVTREYVEQICGAYDELSDEQP